MYQKTINKSSFYAVIHGTRLKMYGWRLFLLNYKSVWQFAACSTEQEGSETTGEVKSS
jgi:hypothetical protein